LVLIYRSTQSHKKILCEKSHNAAPFILSRVIFLITRNRMLRLSDDGTSNERLVNITNFL